MSAYRILDQIKLNKKNDRAINPYFHLGFEN